jgi:hypothetical protein
MGEYMNRNRHRKEKEGIPAFKIGEGDVIRAVDQWLALKKIPHWRINSGCLKNSRGRPVRFGATGMADFYAIGPAPEGKSIWIECKRPKGGIVSEAQHEFLDCINRHGGIGIVVNSIESLEQQLKEAEVI